MEKKPKEQKNDTWQRRTGRAYVGPKREDKVPMQVFVAPHIREAIKALAATDGKGAQELVEELIVHAVNENDNKVKEGERLLKENNRKPYRTRLQVLEEKIRELESNPHRSK